MVAEPPMIATMLTGLPAYGPAAISFPAPNAFREGVVVRFMPERGQPWIGNFARGIGGVTALRPELGARSIIVAASGAGYVVNAEARQLVCETRCAVKSIRYEDDLGLVVVSDGLSFEALSKTGVAWLSGRVSWDGMRNVRRQGARLEGEAYSPIEDEWSPFTLDLRNGNFTSGVYSGP